MNEVNRPPDFQSARELFERAQRKKEEARQHRAGEAKKRLDDMSRGEWRQFVKGSRLKGRGYTKPDPTRAEIKRRRKASRV